MFDNWFKSVEEVHTYKYWKNEMIKLNKRTLKFWKDVFEDLTSYKDHNKKD